MTRYKVKAEEERKKGKEQMTRSNLEGDSKTKELEQENKLLKEMIKSVQTMVRVRESEVERYKHKT